MRTTLKQTIAGAWMLLAALALSTASCSQSEDTPDAPNVATGNEPISISIAPKPGFEAGDAQTRSIIQAEAQTRSNDAQTRSTVTDGTGAFAWENGDDIFVALTFNDHSASPTVLYQRWTKNNTATTPVTGWEVIKSWLWGASTKVTDMNWPLGASTCQVQAFYINSEFIYPIGNDGSGFKNFTYPKSGQGDHMIFDKTFSVGEELKIDFAHQTTRVTFKGLKPLTTYTLKLNDDADQLTLPTSFKKEGFAFGDYAAQPFTTDADGTFTRCLPLTSAINASTGEVKINVFAGTTPITEGALQAQSTGGTPAWKTNGLQYIMTAKDFAGGNNPDTAPDLLIPAPIQPGKVVHELNGYYITQPDANPERLYQWASTTSFTEMENDPCKGYGNWRMPTMKDFEAIAGWTTSNPFKVENITNGNPANPNTLLSNPTVFHAAFSANENHRFWSSQHHTVSSYSPHALILKIDNSNNARYSYHGKTGDCLIRCVQKK